MRFLSNTSNLKVPLNKLKKNMKKHTLQVASIDSYKFISKAETKILVVQCYNYSKLAICEMYH